LSYFSARGGRRAARHLLRAACACLGAGSQVFVFFGQMNTMMPPVRAQDDSETALERFDAQQAAREAAARAAAAAGQTSAAAARRDAMKAAIKSVAAARRKEKHNSHMFNFGCGRKMADTAVRLVRLERLEFIRHKLHVFDDIIDDVPANEQLGQHQCNARCSDNCEDGPLVSLFVASLRFIGCLARYCGAQGASLVRALLVGDPAAVEPSSPSLWAVMHLYLHTIPALRCALRDSCADLVAAFGHSPPANVATAAAAASSPPSSTASTSTSVAPARCEPLPSGMLQQMQRIAAI
jgi:hypothetical protein